MGRGGRPAIRSRSLPCVVVAGRNLQRWSAHVRWPKALTFPSPCSHLLSKSPGGSVPPLWFPRYGALPVVMSLAFRDRCKLKVAWEAWGRKITSPRLEPAVPKPPPDCRPFGLMRDLGNGSSGTFDTDQQRARVNERPQAWAPLPYRAGPCRFSHGRLWGKGTRYPLLRLAPRVLRMQMLFDSQVDEPARPCTLLVSTYIPRKPVHRRPRQVHSNRG